MDCAKSAVSGPHRRTQGERPGHGGSGLPPRLIVLLTLMPLPSDNLATQRKAGRERCWNQFVRASLDFHLWIGRCTNARSAAGRRARTDQTMR